MNARIHNSTHPWTSAQDEKLRILARGNTATSEIAARIGRTPEEVFQRASELGVRMVRGAPPSQTN